MNGESLLLEPIDTPYNGGLYFLSALFPHDYPIRTPKIKFVTPIYYLSVNK